jgi:hypothetical protein
MEMGSIFKSQYKVHQKTKLQALIHTVTEKHHSVPFSLQSVPRHSLQHSSEGSSPNYKYNLNAFQSHYDEGLMQWLADGLDSCIAEVRKWKLASISTLLWYLIWASRISYASAYGLCPWTLYHVTGGQGYSSLPSYSLCNVPGDIVDWLAFVLSTSPAAEIVVVINVHKCVQYRKWYMEQNSATEATMCWTYGEDEGTMCQCWTWWANVVRTCIWWKIIWNSGF